MSSSDPHRGGNLTDMAESGTRMPNDAGQQNTIPSVPRPDQEQRQQNVSTGERRPPPERADNPDDMPRGPRDISAQNNEVVTATGDTMPPEVGTKRLYFGGEDPGAHGSLRTYKHETHKHAFGKEAGEDEDRPADQPHEFRTGASGS